MLLLVPSREAIGGGTRSWEGLEYVGPEGIARPRIAGLHAALQPAHALLGTAVRERVGHDDALGLPLQAVVTNRRGGAQAFLDVARIQVQARRGIGGPDARITVRLQLEHDRQLVALGLAHALLRRVHL